MKKYAKPETTVIDLSTRSKNNQVWEFYKVVLRFLNSWNMNIYVTINVMYNVFLLPFSTDKMQDLHQRITLDASVEKTAVFWSP